MIEIQLSNFKSQKLYGGRGIFVSKYVEACTYENKRGGFMDEYELLMKTDLPKIKELILLAEQTILNQESPDRVVLAIGEIKGILSRYFIFE